MLVQVLYISEIVAAVTDTDVRVLLSAAQMRNRRLDITGSLTQSSAYFAQVLEGREEAINDVIARIARNPLHRDIRTVLRRQIRRRAFGDWSMGYVRREDLANDIVALHDGSAHDGEADRLILGLQEELRWPTSA